MSDRTYVLSYDIVTTGVKTCLFEVEDEINFKALCDVLGEGVKASTIKGTHSQTLVKLMRTYYKNNYKNLTPQQKIAFDNIKAQYKASKLNSGII